MLQTATAPHNAGTAFARPVAPAMRESMSRSCLQESWRQEGVQP